MSSRRPAAVLWDMDGTLIDTEPYWIATEATLCAEHDVEWTEDDALSLVGTPLDVAAGILQEAGVDASVDEIVALLVDGTTAAMRARIPWQPDAVRLLDRLEAHGIPMALVTMSYRKLVNVLLEQRDCFDVVVTGEEVTCGKPDPEAYVLAAERLGVDIADCLAIEDSPSGTRSAHAAGARVVAIQRIVSVESLPGISRLLSLDSLDEHGIARVIAGERIDEITSVGPEFR